MTVPKDYSDLEQAMRDANVQDLDNRGLMPLDLARRILRTDKTLDLREIDEGGKQIPPVTRLDLGWAALLSLETCAEFLSTVEGLQWRVHPRGRDNIAPHLRYGDEILSWVSRAVDSRGVLNDAPWCLLPCLLAIDAKEALDLAATVTGLDCVMNGERENWFYGEMLEPDYVLVSWVKKNFKTFCTSLEEWRPSAVIGARSLARAEPRGFPARLRSELGEISAARLLNRLGVGKIEYSRAVKHAVKSAPRAASGIKPRVNSGDIYAMFETLGGPVIGNSKVVHAAMSASGWNVAGAARVVVQCITFSPIQDKPYLQVFISQPSSTEPESLTLLDRIDEREYQSEDFAARALEMLATPYERTYLSFGELQNQVHSLKGAVQVFELREWTPPFIGHPPAECQDVQLIIHALGQGRAISEGIDPIGWPSLIASGYDRL